MALPVVSYLKGPCYEFSSLQCLNCVGPFYADQIARVCGRNTLGQFLAFCSQRSRQELIVILRACSRNMRAGEPNEHGRAIPEVNVRVLASLLQLLALGRKQPQLFPNYPIQITVPSADLNEMLQNLLS